MQIWVDNTDLQLWTVTEVSGTGLVGNPLTFQNVRRTLDGTCPTFMAPSSTSTCADNMLAMADQAAPGAQGWELEAAGGANTFYIKSLVRQLPGSFLEACMVCCAAAWHWRAAWLEA